MLSHQTLEKLHQLRLLGMVQSYQEQLQSAQHHDLSFDERLGMLVEQEWLRRENNKLSRRLSQAKLKHSACLENLDFKRTRGLEKSKIMDLALCRWVKQPLNIIITGPTGVGKSYLASALAHTACLKGATARYYRLSQLFDEIHVAKAAGDRRKLFMQLAKIDILILDDWGLQSFTTEQRYDLLDLIDDRYGIRATIITSQKPTTLWYEHLKEDPTVADAILDRLLHSSIKIELTGDSMRKLKSSEDKK